jgi:glycerol-3-phosphate dehydrogenase
MASRKGLNKPPKKNPQTRTLQEKSREEVWDRLADDWDVLIIGGGITGAGILFEAARLGLKAVLVEGRDFAWGTSSRSSKLVHGGLRYLKQGKVMLTRASVLERQHLLEEGQGLIDPLGFLISVREGDFPGRWTFEMGLTVYDLLALRWDHRYYTPQDFRMLAPHVNRKDLEGGFRYGDAQTDDARLVLRVLQEAAAAGGTALNYVRAVDLLRSTDGSGRVNGAVVHDELSGRTQEAHARVVINATGAWADGLRKLLGQDGRIRPLRGSHLIFPAWKFPAAQAVTFLHPLDDRPVFIFPWEGVTLVGTTDVDHRASLDQEPGISPYETAYLMAAVASQFPELGLRLEDVISSYAGVRPVIGTGMQDPSKESREHVIWDESGLVTVTGGKLTTFRLIARDVLKAARPHLPEMPEPESDPAMFERFDGPLPGELDAAATRRLTGRYGRRALDVIEAGMPGELEKVAGAPYLWAELRYAARAEHVVHLDDLLLRRVRLGLLLPNGGAELLEHIRPICQSELGWDDDRWRAEESAYRALIRECYNLPAHNEIPDWKAILAEAEARRAKSIQTRKRAKRLTVVGAALALLAGLAAFLYRRTSRKDISTDDADGHG